MPTINSVSNQSESSVASISWTNVRETTVTDLQPSTTLSQTTPVSAESQATVTPLGSMTNYIKFVTGIGWSEFNILFLNILDSTNYTTELFPTTVEFWNTTSEPNV